MTKHTWAPTLALKRTPVILEPVHKPVCPRDHRRFHMYNLCKSTNFMLKFRIQDFFCCHFVFQTGFLFVAWAALELTM